MSDKIYGCRCGAHNASEAAYLQMNRTQQLDFRIRVRNRQTCAYDAKAGVGDTSSPTTYSPFDASAIDQKGISDDQ